MQIRLFLSSILMLHALSACSLGYRNPNDGLHVAESEIRLSWAELDARKAADDARSAIGKGQRHLLGIYGYATKVPGAPVASDIPVLIIEDTGDVIRNKAHSAFNERAYEYARRYNLTVLEALAT